MFENAKSGCPLHLKYKEQPPNMIFKNLLSRYDKRTELLAWLDNYLSRFHFVKSFREFYWKF